MKYLVGKILCFRNWYALLLFVDTRTSFSNIVLGSWKSFVRLWGFVFLILQAILVRLRWSHKHNFFTKLRYSKNIMLLGPSGALENVDGALPYDKTLCFYNKRKGCFLEATLTFCIACSSVSMVFELYLCVICGCFAMNVIVQVSVVLQNPLFE